MGKIGIIGIGVLCFLLLSCQKDKLETVSLEIKGETLCLKNEEPTKFLFPLASDEIRVYSISKEGVTKDYIKEVDYKLVNNTIQRTKNSTIPNFADHRVVYKSNHKFEWLPEPNRNPELTIPYVSYVDYSTPLVSTNNIQVKSQFVKDLKIVTIGTSISFGAHTHAQYYTESDSQTYPNLIAKALSGLTGFKITVKNMSTDGCGVNQIQDLNLILHEKPDIVILELGMNDHLGSSSDSYLSSLEKAINVFKQEGIDIILVGFFQQNPDWELENVKNTVKYNEILQELSSDYELYFADIYSAFESIDKNKLYKDLMGDFMHHPTSFGHQLYYLEVMPFFLTEKSHSPELLKFLY